ncbi:tetratricopeptide repeat protein [bacterium]|nr:tetratricopeptide repeat protein [bacterium]
MQKPKKRIHKPKQQDDKIVATFLKVRDFYEQYQRYIIIGMIALVVVVASSFYISNTNQQKEHAASADLAAARLELASMNTAAAIDSLEGVVLDYDGTKSAGLACFYLANAYLNIKNYDSAEGYFDKYLDDYKGDPMLTSSAMSGLATCAEATSDFAKAAKLFKKSADKYGTVSNTARKLMDAARCYRKAGKTDDARKIYERLIEEYPDSGFINDAEQFLAELNV